MASTSNELDTVISTPEATTGDAAISRDASPTDPISLDAQVAPDTDSASNNSDLEPASVSTNDPSSEPLSTTSAATSSTSSITFDTTAVNSAPSFESSYPPMGSSNDDSGVASTADASTIVRHDAGPPDASVVDAALGSPDAAPVNDVDAAETEPPLTCESTTVLPGIVRDFDEEHPDMEPCDDDGVDCSSERGLVAPLLGSDNKPIFVAEARDVDSTIQSQETFDQWFRDVEDVNVAIPFDLRLSTRPRMVVFDSDNPPSGSPAGFSQDPQGFFPIDDWNETERPHNYSFTYEVSSYIEFQAGDTLTIRGDDDIFVFIDRHLVVDLGGIHLPQEATVEFDALAEEYGLQPNTIYEFHLFFAERHVEQSNLRLSTNGQFYSCTSE